jgi:hypothetical protein
MQISGFVISAADAERIRRVAAKLAHEGQLSREERDMLARQLQDVIRHWAPMDAADLLASIPPPSPSKDTP